MGNLYNEKSIESLSPLEFTRLRPGVYCGNTSYSTQLLVEIVSNSVDEFRNGHGNKIDVTINKDKGEISVRDFGQGFITNSFREDGKTILEAAFSVLNTSGKYRSDGSYEGTSLGSFGIGSKITTFLSNWLKVSTFRDNKYETIWFDEGIFSKRETGKSTGSTGTYVSWHPSTEFFTSTEVEIPKVESLFKTIACLCPGLEITLLVLENGKLTNQIFESTNGLNDLIDDSIIKEELLKNRFNLNMADGKYKMDMVFTYTSNYSSTIVPYVNTGLTEKGPHITQIKTLLTREFNKFFKEKGWLKEKDENLSGDDIQEGLYMVFNITAPDVAYDSQVKTNITKLEMKPFTTALVEELQFWFTRNEKEIKVLAEKAILARTAREKARKAKEETRGQIEKKRRKVINPDKLKDAENLGEGSILLCVEGNSASASMAVARDTARYGILGLRGKPLNLLTNSQEKAKKNEEIQLLISALGITPGQYNSSELRYGRVAIASDSDSDGYHIGLLIASALQVLCPEFIQEGRLCWLRSPLYILKNGKQERYFYSDEEIAQLSDSRGELNRAKGLGSLSAEQARKSMFTDEFQRLDVLEYSPEAVNKLKELMGENVVARKQFIFNNIDFSEIKE